MKFFQKKILHTKQTSTIKYNNTKKNNFTTNMTDTKKTPKILCWFIHIESYI